MTYPHNPLEEEKDDERELVRDPFDCIQLPLRAIDEANDQATEECKKAIDEWLGNPPFAKQYPISFSDSFVVSSRDAALARALDEERK